MVEPESELRHLARAHSLNHSASHTRRERTHGKHPCPSHGERPPNICSSNSCWPYPAAPSPKEHRAGGSSFRVGEGFKTSDMCPVPKGCSSHWVMQVWRSRVERQTDGGQGGDGSSRHAHGCPGHFFFFFHLFSLVGGQPLPNIAVVLVIHRNELAMDLHVFPILIPPPTSLSTRSPRVFPVHQAGALL